MICTSDVLSTEKKKSFMAELSASSNSLSAHTAAQSAGHKEETIGQV